MSKRPVDHLLEDVRTFGKRTHVYRNTLGNEPDLLALAASATPFEQLAELETTLKVSHLKYQWDTTGSLDVGAALSGEPECFIRRQSIKRRVIRMGINPSNALIKPAIGYYKAMAYGCLVTAFRKQGYIVEAELAYGGRFDTLSLVHKTGPFGLLGWHARIELGSDLPAEQLAMFATTAALNLCSKLAHTQWFASAPKGTLGGAYQSQTEPLRSVISQEYDVIADRLMETDTMRTMEEWLTRNATNLGISPESIEAMHDVCIAYARRK